MGEVKPYCWMVEYKLRLSSGKYHKDHGIFFSLDDAETDAASLRDESRYRDVNLIPLYRHPPKQEEPT